MLGAIVRVGPGFGHRQMFAVGIGIPITTVLTGGAAGIVIRGVGGELTGGLISTIRAVGIVLSVAIVLPTGHIGVGVSIITVRSPAVIAFSI